MLPIFFTGRVEAFERVSVLGCRVWCVAAGECIRFERTLAVCDDTKRNRPRIRAKTKYNQAVRSTRYEQCARTVRNLSLLAKCTLPKITMLAWTRAARNLQMNVDARSI